MIEEVCTPLRGVSTATSLQPAVTAATSAIVATGGAAASDAGTQSTGESEEVSASGDQAVALAPQAPVPQVPTAAGRVPTALDVMVRDPFANFVVKRMLDVAAPEERARLTGLIRPQLSELRGSL